MENEIPLKARLVIRTVLNYLFTETPLEDGDSETNGLDLGPRQKDWVSSIIAFQFSTIKTMENEIPLKARLVKLTVLNYLNSQILLKGWIGETKGLNLGPRQKAGLVRPSRFNSRRSRQWKMRFH